MNHIERPPGADQEAEECLIGMKEKERRDVESTEERIGCLGGKEKRIKRIF